MPARTFTWRSGTRTMIGYRYHDGGRATPGFKGDTGDCAIRALAILTGIFYADVYRRMAICMKRAGNAASGSAYCQRPRGGLNSTVSPRAVQNLVKASYGLRRIKLAPGPRPTWTEAWTLYGDCLVDTARHVAAMVGGNLRDTFHGRLYDGRDYGGTVADERKAQSIWVPRSPNGTAAAIPEFDPARLIRPPVAIHPGTTRSRHSPSARQPSTESRSSYRRPLASSE